MGNVRIFGQSKKEYKRVMAKIDGVQEVSLEVLKPYENNAKIHNAEQVDRIAKSIEEFGFISPCLIDKDFNIIAGHGRVKAAQQLGLSTVPCVFIEGLTEMQRKAYIIADNRLTELGEWDDVLLNEELENLQLEGFDVDLTGFDFDVAEIPDVDFEDEIPIITEEPTAKTGQVYQLGQHRLMCGDSTKIEDVEKLMDSEKADMVFTDPPWNVNYGAVEDGNAQGYVPRTILNDFMGTEEFKSFMFEAFKCMNSASKVGCMTYVVMSRQEWGNMMLTLAENDYHWSSTIIWNKDTLVLSRKDYHTKYEPIWYGWKDGGPRLCPLEDRKQSDVWDFDRPKKSEEHPTMKPVALVQQAIINSSKKGDIVLDLFGGSGTTLIAAHQTGRVCRMMELDPHYVDVIIKRYEDLTGEKAKLLK